MFSLLAVTMVDETVAFLPFGALEPLRRDLDLTYSRASLLLVLYPGVGLVGSVFGVAADHMSRRVLASLGAAGYGAGLLIFAGAGSFAPLVVAVVVMGLAGDAMVRGCQVALVDVAGDRIETALARANLLGAVGDVAGPLLLAGTLAIGLGWRGAFATAGAALLVYALLLAAQPVPGPQPHPDGHTPMRGLAAAARDRRVLRAGLATGLLNLFDEAFLGFAVAWLIVGRGQHPAMATIVAGAGMVGGVVAMAWAARAGRPRFDRRTTAAVLAAGAVVLVVSPQAWFAAAGAAAVGVGLNLTWVSLQAHFLTLRPGQAGTTEAIVSVVSTPAAFFPLAAGAIADGPGLAAAMTVYAAAAIVLVVLVRGDR